MGLLTLVVLVGAVFLVRTVRSGDDVTGTEVATPATSPAPVTVTATPVPDAGTSSAAPPAAAPSPPNPVAGPTASVPGASPTVGSESPSPGAAPKPSGTRLGRDDPVFDSCGQAVEAGFGPYTQGVDPEYEAYDDPDGDGTACPAGS